MFKSFLTFVVVTGLLIAQEKTPPQAESWGEHLGPAAPNAAVVPLDWAQQSVLAERHAASAAWRSEHPGWRIAFDPRTGMPWRAYGPGIQVASQGAVEEEIVAVAGPLKDRFAAAAGLDPAAFAFVTAQKAGRLWYVDFAQMVSGAPVFNGGMTMRIDQEGRLVMWGGRFIDPTPVAAAPKVGPDHAIGATLAHLAGQGFLTRDTVTEQPEVRPIVHVRDGRESLVSTLAWFVVVRTESPAGWWKVFIDAGDGSVLEYWNDIRESGHHDHEGGARDGVLTFEYSAANPLFMAPVLAMFSGIANGTVHYGVTPQQAPVLQNFNDLYVNCNFTNVVTDATGFYTFSGGGATVPVSSGLDGIHVTTNNNGVQALFSATGSSGTLDVIWTDVNSNLAERDAFFFTNLAWNTLILRNPTETLFGASIPAYVNLSQTCNAYYNGTSINFFAAGGGCINTAYSTSVVVHEYGHHVTIVTYNSHGKSIPGGLGEGYSDCQGGAVTDSSIVGEGWQGPGTMVRNLDNTCQYPASCGTEVHQAGKVIGACYWHTRQLFAAAYGAAGKVMMDEYLYRHFHGTPLNEIESCMEMLLLNDTDANLANGTPDADKFYQGFTVLHSVPFPVPVIAIAHVPLSDTMDQLQGYQVHASGTPYFGGSIASATTYYAINAGPFIPLPMVDSGGGDYVASIPVQPAGTTVRYYIQFQDSSARIAKLPAGGAGSPFSFLTFRRSQFYFDGFEVASGWVSATFLGANDWHNQAPGNPNHAWDPATAHEGTKCWGNDLSPAANWNGNYPNNVNNSLTSPTINCTGKTGVSLVYRRWLTVEDGIYDHARLRVSNDGGVIFTTVWENAPGNGVQHHIDTAWVEHAIGISALADNQANVKVRFEMVSDAGLTFGGWNIDAFSLASALVTPPLSQLGSNVPGNLATIRTTGLPGDAVVLAADVMTSATFYAGVGTLSLNAGSPSLLLLFDGTQTIPPGGVLDLTFTVPSASGVTAYFEGVLVPASSSPPLLITNVLPFTIL